MATLPSERAGPSDGCQRLMVVDDHEVVLAGLVAALSQEPHIELVGTATTGQEAVDLARRIRPDVAIIDLRLPDTSGDKLCRELKSRFPEISVIVLSSYLTEESVRAAIGAGASSYVTKAAGLAELRAAITRTQAGADGCPAPLSVSQIVARLQQFAEARAESGTPTPQQARVLELAADGLTYREIARRLVVSEATVRFHIQNLKLKYGVASKTELIVRAIRMGLVTPPDYEATQ